MRPTLHECRSARTRHRQYRAPAVASRGWTRTLASAVAVVLCLGTWCGGGAATSKSKRGRWQWSVPRVMRAIHDRAIQVGARRARIDSETVLCSGEGPPTRRRSLPMWSRFSCTFTTFTTRGVDRDVNFEVVVRGPERYEIRSARWVQGALDPVSVAGARSQLVRGSPKSRLGLLIVVVIAIVLLGVAALPRGASPQIGTATIIVRVRVACAALGLAALAVVVISYFVT